MDILQVRHLADAKPTAITQCSKKIAILPITNLRFNIYFLSEPVSKMTYFVSSATLTLTQSINRPTEPWLAGYHSGFFLILIW